MRQASYKSRLRSASTVGSITKGKLNFVRIAGNQPNLVNAAFIVALGAVTAFVMDVNRPLAEQVSARAAIRLIDEYQHSISGKIPFIHCRFAETCSMYAMRAFATKGFIGGFTDTVHRLQMCF